jgi:dTDP-4-amino-4,6-dideoxygalactose transaminase
MSVQLFVPQFRIDECLEEIRTCLEKGWTGLGFKTVEFETAWRSYTGLPHAHFLSSNTVGLHLAFYMMKTQMDWSDDSEVITTPITFVSTNHAILQARLKPVFADVDESGCLCPDSVAERINEKTKALIFVGLGGNVGRYEEILALCKSRGIKLILDAAHMSGTRYADGTHIGGDADIAVFSFQAVKNLPTADSGMICFSNAADDARARKLSWLGINKDTYSRTASEGAYKWMYEVEELGFKYHGNSIMAAIALVQLRYLDQDNAYRRQVASWYDRELDGCSNVHVVPQSSRCEPSRHLYQIRVKNRDQLMVALNQHEIFPGVHYRNNTDYAIYRSQADQCPNAKRFSEEVISLPMHLGVDHAAAGKVAALIRRYAEV